MSVNKYNDQTGELQVLANGSRIWVGTKEAYEQARQAGTMPTDILVALTNDDEELAQEVIEDDPRAVTGGAVYTALQGGSSNPLNLDDTDFSTEGLTYENAEYFRGGYIQVGSVVFVNMSVRITSTPTSAFATHPAVKGLPLAKDFFVAVPWVDNYGHSGAVRMSPGSGAMTVSWTEDSGVQQGVVATFTFTYVAASSK